jgi:hypothetical protein
MVSDVAVDRPIGYPKELRIKEKVSYIILLGRQSQLQ